MKAAFAGWDNRIAPVFDVVREIHLVEAENGQVLKETKELLADGLPVQKALRLAELGVGTLVCGAISRTLRETVAANGIRIIAFVAGDLREVIQAWLSGSLSPRVFAMPGCRGRFREMGQYREERYMNRRGGMKGGKGGGQGRGGQGRGGQRGGRFAAGAGGSCVCTQCGQREPHERGVPCMERKCPKCGAVMARE